MFAPQADAGVPPVTITIYAVDATQAYDAAITAAGATSPSDYDLLVTLVGNYANDAKLAKPKMSRNTYNTGVNSSIVRVDLIAEWPTPFAWRPAATSAPTPAPAASVTPASSASATPVPSPTVRPLSYPALGPEVAGSSMNIVQAYYLPDGEFYLGLDQNRVPFRKMVVLTLSYPANLDPAVIAEARATFDRVASTISFS